MTQPEQKPCLKANSIKDTAKALAISPRTLWRMIGTGEIKSIKLSARRTVITDAEIERILAPQIDVS